MATHTTGLKVLAWTNHKTWLRELAHCEHKYVDSARLRRGNFLCALKLPIGKRCMYRTCPLMPSTLSDGRA